jgi:RNA polymerase sigma factor (sigma-70 family)
VKALIEARPKYIRFANSILANTQDAEDVVQDCYIRLYEKEESAEIANREAYMMQAVRNACLDHLKKKRPEALQERYEEEYEVPADIIRQIESKEQYIRLEKLLSLLPEKQRTVFYLRDIEACELKEIETVTGLSNEGVRTCLCRARKQLKILYSQVQ